jgi:hypothetical protein
MGAEANLIAAIKRLTKTLHQQSLTGASMAANGTPDRYYDGDRSDLWVEYKALTSIPRSGIVIGAYTQLQLAWMERRYKNESTFHTIYGQPCKNVIGVVGLPNRTAVIQFTPKEWREGSPVTNARTIKDVAAWIHAFCSLSQGP